jgi:hypothetical protein
MYRFNERKKRMLDKSFEKIINSYDELIPAMQCLLWSMNNEPNTNLTLYKYIKFNDNGDIRSLNQNDYQYLNPIIRSAPSLGLLSLEKILVNDKEVWLYSNPSKYRNGWFFDGKLRHLRELEMLTGISKSTLYKRLSTMSLKNAIELSEDNETEEPEYEENRYNIFMSDDNKPYEEEVIPFIRIYISYGKKNNDMLELEQVVSFLSQDDGPANHIKDLIDKGMFNLYACCYDKVTKVL